jgi:hypothetical protein
LRPSGRKSTTPSSICSFVARCWVRFGIIKTPFDPQGHLHRRQLETFKPASTPTIYIKN